MKINDTEIIILGANPDVIAAALNEEFPTRNSLVGSHITAYGKEFAMLEENLGMSWIQFFLKMLKVNTTGISCLLGKDPDNSISVRWTFQEAD